MTKVRCSMVISPNGFISKPDGNEDWISDINWDDFVADCEACNNFVVGRTTYEVVPELDEIKVQHKIVVSKNNNLEMRPGYTLVNSPKEAADYLNNQNVKKILLAGGGKLNSSFAEVGLIDELEFIVEPYIVGMGKEVLAMGDYEFPLELLAIERLTENRIRLRYKIIKNKGEL